MQSTTENHDAQPSMRSICFKFWFFDNYWWLLTLTVVVVTSALLFWKEPIATVATVVGALLSIAYFLQKQKLDELRLFRELFKEFNERYDVMNEDLARISKISPDEIQAADKAKVIDYFNLCGEEYLYFRKGYIDPKVWLAWHNGMSVLASTVSIKAIWDKEKESNSYYGLPL